MTSAAVTETSANLMKTVGISKNQMDDKAESFSNVMNHTSKDIYEKNEPVKVTDRNSYLNPAGSVKPGKISQNNEIHKQENKIADGNTKPQKTSNAEKVLNQEQNVSESDKVQNDEQNVDNALDETKQKIMNELAEELDVSPEEVEEAMQLLGLSIIDLMQQGNMAKLVAQISGNDVVTALTDETFFAQVNQLTESATVELSDLAKDLGVDVKQLEELISNQMNADDLSTETDMVNITVETDSVLKPENEKIQTVSTVAEPTMVETNNEEEKTEQSGNLEAESDINSALGEKPEEQITTNKADHMNEKNSNGEKKGHDDNGGVLLQKTDVNYDMTQQLADGIKTSDTFMESFDSARTREIIDQIADYVKIHNSSQISEMEIQLNPEHLGNVNLQVVSKNGTISAQLTAGDELVRAALESQVAQLRETLQAQGLKVDAVEVTIASHEFEQNLEQNNKDEQNGTENTEKRSSRKLLNLDELPDDETADAEQMTDADLLQIQMMRLGGNKLNYQV